MEFKAFIRVVKSIASRDEYFTGGFDTVEVIREPLIIAKDKAEVKAILLEKYPHFFQNNKVYEKETKDQAQFFYVVIFPLYNHEIELINEGEWECEYCKQKYENKYLHRPVKSKKFEGKLFCNTESEESTCYEKWKIKHFSSSDLPDDLAYISEKSPTYIYKCTEKSTGKCYIGKTRNAPFFRWWNHLTHSSSPFGIYLRQTKLSEWTFEVLEELPSNISDSEVFKIESKYILLYDSINQGFNSVISSKQG